MKQIANVFYLLLIILRTIKIVLYEKSFLKEQNSTSACTKGVFKKATIRLLQMQEEDMRDLLFKSGCRREVSEPCLL